MGMLRRVGLCVCFLGMNGLSLDIEPKISVGEALKLRSKMAGCGGWMGTMIIATTKIAAAIIFF